MIPAKVLQTAATLLHTPQLTELGREEVLGVYEYIEKGKHESRFMLSLKEQAELNGTLSPRQLEKAAGILKGAFKHYLETTHQHVEYQQDGTVKLVPMEPVAPAPQPEKPKRAPRKRKIVLAQEAG